MRITLDPLATAIFAFVVLCWVAFAASFAFRKSPPRNDAPERKRERASLFGIGLQGAGYALAWGFHRRYFTPPTGSEVFNLAVALLAAALAISSVWFVVAAARTLGRQWSFAARVIEGHRLVTEGPYSLVRHPIYTGMLGMLLATCAATTLPLAVPFALAVFVAGTLVRVRSEEKLLRETFGAEFDAYARRVGAFIPGVL
ncbi:MAG: isoprenylcysteine carboxylmethyltransferase family protein [Acidobacteria bacterium]|nr:isoprenylcysteine carboxylmethyltransferase family protein [Acidobacteriota bacterium]